MNEIDIYKHNWYKRNKETWVYGEPVSVKHIYSNMLYSESQVNRFFSNYSVLENELKDLLYNTFNKKLNVKISDESEDTYTDGKNIVISSQQNIENKFDRLDVIIGLAIHEVAHCLYTDFKFTINKKIYCNPLLKYIHNILEDEEIENRIINRFSTCSKYLGKTKHFIFGTKGKDVLLKETYVNQLDEIMSLFLYIVRYPKYLEFVSTDILDKYKDFFIKANNILINSNCPAAVSFINCPILCYDILNNINITETTVNASFEIYKYLQDYIADDFNKMRNELEENEDSIINSSLMPIASGEENPDIVNSMIDNIFGMSMPHDDIYLGSNDGCELKINTDKVRFPNKSKYLSFYNDIKEYIPLIKKLIIPNEIKQKDVLQLNRFRRNGNLDTNRLAEAMQNINTVYNQRITIKKNIIDSNSKYAFVIIMDESGSMRTRDKRNEFAVKMSILFYEVLSKFKDIELYVYGHGDRIVPYITKELTDKYVLGNFDCQGNQNDYESYKRIIADVKRQTNLPIVSLTVTDFYYHSNDICITNLFQEFKKSNVSFNMLNLGTRHTPREKNICQTILDGQVIDLININNTREVRNALIELCKIIKDNYNKYNKK